MRAQVHRLLVAGAAALACALVALGTAGEAHAVTPTLVDTTLYLTYVQDGDSATLRATATDYELDEGGGSLRTFSRAAVERVIVDGSSKTGTLLTLDGTTTGAYVDLEFASGIRVFGGVPVAIKGVIRAPQGPATTIDLATPITLIGNTELWARTIDVSGTIDGAFDLRLEAAGELTLDGAIGDQTPLKEVWLQAFDGASMGGGGIRVTDTVRQVAPITLTADAAVIAPTLYSQAAIDGPHDLAITSTTYVGLRGPVGAQTPLASLDVQTENSYEIETSTIATSGPQTHGGPGMLRIANHSVTFAASRVAISTASFSCGTYDADPSQNRACDLADTITFDVTDVRGVDHPNGSVITVDLGNLDGASDPALPSSDNTFNLAKTGPGTLTLSEPGHHLGTTTVSEGTLVAADATALGSTAAGTTVASGATLEVAAVALAAEPLTLNGAGVDGEGALRGTGTSSTAASATIDLATSSRIGAAAGATFTVDSVLDGSTMVKSGSGTLILTAANTHDWSSVGYGTLEVGHANALGGASDPTVVDGGATLRIADGVTLAAGVGQLLLGSSGTNQSAVLDLPGGGTISRGIVLGGRTRIQGGSDPSPVVLTGAFLGAGHDLMLAGVVTAPSLTGLGSLELPLGSTASIADRVAASGTVDVDGILHLRTAATAPISLGVEAARLTGAGQLTAPVGQSGTLELDLSGDGTFSGGIANGSSIGVRKRGAGTLTIAGDPSFQDALQVDAGGVRVTGTLPSTVGTAVAGNAVLSGSGAVGDVTLTGALDLQSAGIDSLATGTLMTRAGAALRIAVRGTTASATRVTGIVALDGPPTLDVAIASAPADGARFVIIDNDGSDAVNGTFASLAEGATVTPTFGSGTFRVSYRGGDGNDVELTYVAPPPAPQNDSPRDPSGDRSPAGTTPRALTAGAPKLGPRGVLRTRVTVSGPGRIVQVATGRAARATTTRACRTTRIARKAGTYVISCRLSTRARAALRRAPLTLTVVTTFTPTGGAATTTRATLTAPRSR